MKKTLSILLAVVLASAWRRAGRRRSTDKPVVTTAPFGVHNRSATNNRKT